MGTQLVAISETARQLGVSSFTVRRLVSRGDIVAVNVGARRLIPATEIERIVHNGVGQPRATKVITSGKRSRRARK